MKSTIQIFVLALASLTMMATTAFAVDATYQIDVSLPPQGDTAPTVCMISRMLTTDGINVYQYRNGQYAFTGEQIIYKVLVRDVDGAQDISKAEWFVGDSAKTICTEITPQGPTTCSGMTYDSQTDKVYQCTLTVAPDWTGTKTTAVIATDVLVDPQVPVQIGTTVFETWKFNPALSVSVSTSDNQPLSFSNMDVTTRLSNSENSLIVKNTGTADLWIFLAGSDFTASSGIAKCPTSNVLSISNFKYQAIAGTVTSLPTTVPKYNSNSVCTMVPFPTCYNGNKIPSNSLDSVSTNGIVQVNLQLHYPLPCIGNFDTGSFYAIVRAV